MNRIRSKEWFRDYFVIATGMTLQGTHSAYLYSLQTKLEDQMSDTRAMAATALTKVTKHPKGDVVRARHGLRKPLTLVRQGAARYSTGLGQVVVRDCRSLLRDLPDECLDLVVTSPPYDGQPKYGNGETYERDWYSTVFMDVATEVLRTLKPHGSFVVNYRSKRHGDERGTLQYELIFMLREKGFLFCEDFVWGKPSPPPGRFNRFLKDAIEYCFQFAKTPAWQFFPEHCLSPARWDAKDRERRRKLAHNYVRVNEPSGQGRKRVQAGPDMVRPSTLLLFEPEFGPNPVAHPARFPLDLPTFFIKLLSKPGQMVFDPFGGTGTTAVAAEKLARRWLVAEIDPKYAAVIPTRLQKGR